MGVADGWSWREGQVNRQGEHLSLTHNETGDEVLALVGPPRDHVFPVEMRRRDSVDHSTMERVLTDVRRELDYYLVELGEPNPPGRWGVSAWLHGKQQLPGLDSNQQHFG